MLLLPLRDAGYELAYGPADRRPTEADLIDLLPGCVGYLAGTEPITRAVLAAADGLKSISRYGSGVDNIDLEAAAAAGISVNRAAGSNARSVAELTLALLLNGVRHVSMADRAMRSGLWERPTGSEVQGRRLGIVGYGAVGRIVEALATAIGMRCVVYDPFDSGRGASERSSEREQRLEALLARCPMVTLHCPPQHDGLPLLGRHEFSMVLPGTVLVNTARWSLVDPAAVIDALDRGIVSVYAVDSFRHEPPVDDPMVTHPRTIVTSHIGAQTEGAIERTARDAVTNLLVALRVSDEGDRVRQRADAS